ncbi:zinc-binding dehydrogenase, partial [Streptomyces flavofungini]|uniref:zinc-binding dehydrogenase n=1 Tax=Streptomyces flavofungini TaxID=68200 RepID=UPI0034DEE712
LVNGASGSVGSAAVQLAVARGARVIGTAGPANHDCLRTLGAEPVSYGEGLRVIGTAGPGKRGSLRTLGAEPVSYGEGLGERVRALVSGAPGASGAATGIGLALDVAGSGVLPELIRLTGAPERVVTLADFAGAREHGVRFSRGDTGRAMYALDVIGALIESGRFVPPVVRTFPLTGIAEAHRLGEEGHVRGKIVLVVG